MPQLKRKFFDTIIKLWGGIGEKQNNMFLRRNLPGTRSKSNLICEALSTA